MKDSVKLIQSVRRALDIVNCVEAAGRGLTMREIGERVGLNVNTTRGLAQTLLQYGYLSKNLESGAYVLGNSFLTKSKVVYEQQVRQIRNAARPEMEYIAQKLLLSCWLQIGFYRNIQTVEVVQSPTGHYSYAPRTGASLPLHASASGKLYVAYQKPSEREKLIENLPMVRLTPYTIADRDRLRREADQVYRDGYATELEEVDLGISSVAVPLFDSLGLLAATISVAGPSVIMESALKQVAEELGRAADRAMDTLSIQRRAVAGRKPQKGGRQAQ